MSNLLQPIAGAVSSSTPQIGESKNSPKEVSSQPRLTDKGNRSSNDAIEVDNKGGSADRVSNASTGRAASRILNLINGEKTSFYSSRSESMIAAGLLISVPRPIGDLMCEAIRNGNPEFTPKEINRFIDASNDSTNTSGIMTAFFQCTDLNRDNIPEVVKALQLIVLLLKNSERKFHLALTLHKNMKKRLEGLMEIIEIDQDSMLDSCTEVRLEANRIMQLVYSIAEKHKEERKREKAAIFIKNNPTYHPETSNSSNAISERKREASPPNLKGIIFGQRKTTVVSASESDFFVNNKNAAGKGAVSKKNGEGASKRITGMDVDDDIMPTSNSSTNIDRGATTAKSPYLSNMRNGSSIINASTLDSKRQLLIYPELLGLYGHSNTNVHRISNSRSSSTSFLSSVFSALSRTYSQQTSAGESSVYGSLDVTAKKDGKKLSDLDDTDINYSDDLQPGDRKDVSNDGLTATGSISRLSRKRSKSDPNIVLSEQKSDQNTVIEASTKTDPKSTNTNTSTSSTSDERKVSAGTAKNLEWLSHTFLNWTLGKKDKLKALTKQSASSQEIKTTLQENGRPVVKKSSKSVVELEAADSSDQDSSKAPSESGSNASNNRRRDPAFLTINSGGYSSNASSTGKSPQPRSANASGRSKPVFLKPQAPSDGEIKNE